MNAGASKPARVPTLTEVIEVAQVPDTAPAVEWREDAETPWERTARFQAPQHPMADTAGPPEPAPQPPGDPIPLSVTVSMPPPAIDEERLADRILADVQRQVGVMLEHRIRETMAPALARLTEAIVQEARVELASALRDMVARAVAQELARQRAR